MPANHLKDVQFDFIRYANCWEDAHVLLKGFDLQPDSKVISIGSAGDNCLAMLAHQPQWVVAVDISEVQLYLIELKKVAIAQLDYPDFLSFMGFTSSTKRLTIFNQIKAELSETCRLYWISHEDAIKEGVIHTGKFERYFQLFKRDVLPNVHNQDIIDELFRSKSAEEQKEFHTKTWNTPAWQKMYRHFFGVEMMGSHGRDPAFLKHVKGSVPDLILEREMAHLSIPNCQKNYFLHYILNNTFTPEFLPFYALEENYREIQKNTDRLLLHHGMLDSALERHPNATHFNLSDIFEYMDEHQFSQVIKHLLDHSAPHAKLAYWNLLIPRYAAQIFPKRLKHLKTLSENLKKEDLGYFYGDLIFDQKL